MEWREGGDGVARLGLPFAERNANPGNALHGGCAASLAATGGQVIARAALGTQAGPLVTAGLQVNYLAAAIDEEVLAVARLQRRGKSLCFASVDVHTGEGKPIAAATVAIAARGDKPPVERPPSTGDDEGNAPGAMGPGIEKLGFISARGIRIEHMDEGTSRLRMPAQEGNGDADGGTHEGAALALLDTAGAMAAWGEHGIGPYKASTPSLQAQVLAPLPAADLVAYGSVAHRDEEMFWVDVELVAAGHDGVLARGTVLYRIVS